MPPMFDASGVEWNASRQRLPHGVWRGVAPPIMDAWGVEGVHRQQFVTQGLWRDVHTSNV